MTRQRNKRIADGERRHVVEAQMTADGRWMLRLDCHHLVLFKSAGQPKRIRCPICLARSIPQVTPIQGGQS